MKPELRLRVGIHLGEVVFSDDDVFGDGVNIASRIEELAVPGSILVSEKAWDELQNQADISAEFVGQFQLKNDRRARE